MTVIQLVRAKTWGGGEQYALDLSRRLIADGHKVVVASKGVESLDSRFRSAGAQVIHLPLGGIFDLRSPRQLANFINGLPEDHIIVHVHTFKDAEIVARARKFLSSTKTIRLIVSRHLVKKGKKSRRWKFIYDNIDALVFVSDFAKREFLSNAPPVDIEKIKVIHNSILLPSEYSTAVPLPDATDPTMLLFTGRITDEKGIDVLIRALRLLSDLPIRLRIAGTGEPKYIAFLQDLARNEGVDQRIEWIGFCRDVFPEIRKAHICVAPSTARESFGLTIIEDMSQGRPVITTDHGAQPEIITSGEDGLLVPPDDPVALAEAIRRMVTDSDFREKVAKKAAATFSSRFSYNAFYNRVLSVYQPT